MTDNPQRPFSPSHAHLVALLGQKVRVTLDHDGPVVQEGILLGWGNGGDIELEANDGMVYHCWPRLHIEPVQPTG